MNFSDEKYRIGLNDLLNSNIVNIHDKVDCFYELINGIDKRDLDNLIKFMVDFSELTEDECYKLLQNKKIPYSLKYKFMELAYKCLDLNMPLGNNVTKEGFNTSSYLAHSLEVARVCQELASKMNLDSDKAFRMGMLHDYGRKYKQNFDHVRIGFEKLYDLGYFEEAIGALTHSYINGKTFAIFESNLKYKLDENNKSILLDKELIKSDIYQFLQTYKYTDYDRILNLADLMATANGVLEPKLRIEDIETRRKISKEQKEYFLSELVNLINYILKRMGNEENIKDFKEASLKIYKKIR